jgi:Restriction endonuclease S subunits
LKSGSYPIVDQGKSKIAGFTNDKNKVISEIQPFVIFGDHTRIIKYIDFLIALGADGTKIIKPNSQFDPKFFYYQLLNINIPSKGYNRHYSILKEKRLSVPSIFEQKVVANILTTVQEAIAGQEKLIAKLKELKQSMMQFLFTHGTKGEKTKMTEIGEIPDSWATNKIRKFGKIVTGNTPSTKKFEYYGEPYKLVSPADLTDALFIDTAHRKITKEGLMVARSVPKNSLLVGCIGNVGKIGITQDEITAFNQQINAIAVNDDFNYLFVYYLLIFYREILESKSAKVTLPILNKSNFEEIEFYTPDIVEQEKIADILYSIDKKIETIQNRLSAYQNLFKTLLHELMSGDRKVNF